MTTESEENTTNRELLRLKTGYCQHASRLLLWFLCFLLFEFFDEAFEFV